MADKTKAFDDMTLQEMHEWRESKCAERDAIAEEMNKRQAVIDAKESLARIDAKLADMTPEERETLFKRHLETKDDQPKDQEINVPGIPSEVGLGQIQ